MSEASGESTPPNMRPRIHVLEPRPGWRGIDFRELWEYRDLLYFLVLRELRVRYAQSAIGIGWAIIQPLFFMAVFTVIFGRLVKVDSDGVPYPVFSYAAMVPWSFFSASFTEATGSLIQNQNMLSKVYFPRLIMPIGSVLAKLVDFAIAFIILFVLMAWFRVMPTAWILVTPLLVVIMMLTAAGIGTWFTALAVQYRDVKHVTTFGVQVLMYATPVVYSVRIIPERLRPLYALNPMVGVIEGFRSAFLGTGPMPWGLITIGGAISVALFVTGVLYFRRTERVFADVV